MKDVRLYSTEKEKIAKEWHGTDSNFTLVNTKEDSIDSLIKKEKASKFNSEVEQYNEKLEQNYKDFKDSQDKIEYDINKAEIKPMFARVLVQPFKINPFQKMKVKNGVIVDTGGYTPHTQFNEQTGRYEEQKQFIVTGCVIEVGPEVKYLKEGDVIFYRVDTAVPVPFFKQEFVSLAESQIIATVAENLTERFNSIKNNA
jgi:hypothetical protein